MSKHSLCNYVQAGSERSKLPASTRLFHGMQCSDAYTTVFNGACSDDNTLVDVGCSSTFCACIYKLYSHVNNPYVSFQLFLYTCTFMV